MITARTKSCLLFLLLLATAAGLAPAHGATAPLGRGLARALEAPEGSADGTLAVWVRFADKGLAPGQVRAALADAAADVEPAVLARRAKAGHALDEADLPLCRDYLAAVAATGARARHESRWLNASSWDATPAQVEAIARLPFVASLDLVGRGGGARPEPDPQPLPRAAAQGKALGELDYGASLPALDQLNLPAAHALGLTGRGVTVAVLDTGFDLDHEAFTDLDVVAARDFVNGGDDVGQQPDEDIYQTYYGTAALSLLAGYDPGNQVGAAWGVSVILAKTEDLAAESPIEEDNWIAAVEWAEGLGADIVSSGVGYIDWYDYADLDGRTAAITVAAEMAVARGVCVVNSAGNLRASDSWPHIVPPADAAGVVAVGACDVNGQVAWFSSPGPTADGRIKPDLLAPGQDVAAAFYLRRDIYTLVGGSNVATPLVAGVAALMLERNPALNPAMVMADLHAAGNRAALPDNDFGWGLPDALAAVTARTPSIEHTPLKDREGNIGAYALSAAISAPAGVDAARTWVAWRVDGGSWSLSSMANTGGDTWAGTIPPQAPGRTIDYYLVATDQAGTAARHPGNAPVQAHTFRSGPDTTPPVIAHISLGDQVPSAWPPQVSARVTDNLGVGPVTLFFTINGVAGQGPFAMMPAGDDGYILDFPLPEAVAQPGMRLEYFITAMDTAESVNLTTSGPHAFRIVASKGRILLVDDRALSKAAPPARGAAPDDGKSAADLAAWITDAGFTVDVIPAVDVVSDSFLGYDAVMVSSGGNYWPVSYTNLRQAMVNWSAAGGRLLVEGGEIAYAVDISPGYPELRDVLHMASYGGENGVSLRIPPEFDAAPLQNRPHRLPSPLVIDNSAGGDFTAADVVDVADGAVVALRIGEGSLRGGLIAYDDDTGPDAGQSLYMPFNLMKALEAEGRVLLDNCLTWLTAAQAPGSAGISGRVTLAGQTDHGGVVVDAGRGRTAVTAADGTWTIGGLWGGTYRVEASAAGFAPGVRAVEVVDGVESVANFYLTPVVAVTAEAHPEIPIPDNTPAGVASSVVVAEGGMVQGVDVDVNISHFAIGNLVVTLTSPSGTTVTLHNRSGETADDLAGNWPGTLHVDGPGALDDFLGEEAQGTWTLQVADLQFGATGTFHSWGLNILVTPRDASGTDDPATPAVTRLVGNAPNPFNPRTVVAFDLARGGPVRLDVYDVRGRLVRRLADSVFAAGRHVVTWDGRDGRGAEPASGIYFCRLHTDEGAQVHKMTLLR